MKLKRIAVYRATRMLSWVLPVVILALVSIAAWSYWARTREGQVLARTVDELPADLAFSTDGLQYEASDGNKKLFLVKARKMLRFKDERKILEDVEILVYSKKAGDPDRQIRGKECRHDEKNNQVVCSRQVSVELEPGTIARTEQLSYDPASDLISSPARTLLDRKGEMTGKSGKMEYFSNTGLMRLTDGFDIELERGGGMSGGTAVFQYRENWVTVTQGVELRSTNGKINGGSGRADLLPGTSRPKKMIVEMGATAEAPSFTVNSDWLESDLSDTGTIEHVIGRGNVRAERKGSSNGRGGNASESDSLNGTLTGPEVEAWLENGILKIVEAREHPEFIGSSGTKLTAAGTIRIEPAGGNAGSLRTDGQSNFSREGLTIDGRNFVIHVKDEDHEQVFNTSAPATLKSAGLKTSADTTEARFNTRTKTLTSMEQNGNVTFDEEEGGWTGKSGRLTVSEAGDRIDMERGNPNLNDGKGTVLYAQKIMLDRKRESFVGDGKVVMTSSGSTTTAGHVEGQLGGSAPRVDYSRRVQMYPSDGSKVEAENVTVFPKDKRFEAKGKVRTEAAEKRVVTSDALEFSESAAREQTAHYIGNVVVSGYFSPPRTLTEKNGKRSILELLTRDLVVNSRNGDLQTVIATGAVDLTQGSRRGRGERLEYNLTTGDILLMGTNASEAEVSEPDQSFKACTILIAADGSKKAMPCSDRGVTSSIKIKN